ncbi:hypothetical protein L9F63_015070, partial [Diploptera punctata]
ILQILNFWKNKIATFRRHYCHWQPTPSAHKQHHAVAMQLKSYYFRSAFLINNISSFMDIQDHIQKQQRAIGRRLSRIWKFQTEVQLYITLPFLSGFIPL